MFGLSPCNCKHDINLVDEHLRMMAARSLTAFGTTGASDFASVSSCRNAGRPLLVQWRRVRGSESEIEQARFWCQNNSSRFPSSIWHQLSYTAMEMGSKSCFMEVIYRLPWFADLCGLRPRSHLPWRPWGLQNLRPLAIIQRPQYFHGHTM